jgi:hypothetical protein
VAGHAARRHGDRARNLLDGLDRRKFDNPARTSHAAAFGKAEFRIDRVEVLVGDELDAKTGAAFFAGLEQQDHIAIERHIQAFERQHHHQGRDDVVLVVNCSASVDVAAILGAAEWRMGPLLRIDVDGIGVRHQQQGLLLAAAFQPSDEVRTMRFLGKHLDRNAFGFEHLLQVIGDRFLVAGRIGGVHLDDRLEVLQGLGLHRRPVRLRRGLRGQRRRQGGGE